MDKIKILLADDHTIVRDGIHALTRRRSRYAGDCRGRGWLHSFAFGM